MHFIDITFALRNASPIAGWRVHLWVLMHNSINRLSIFVSHIERIGHIACISIPSGGVNGMVSDVRHFDIDLNFRTNTELGNTFVAQSRCEGEREGRGPSAVDS
jgi:hypothetical protein